MALLLDSTTQRLHTLAAHVVVGRSSACSLRIEDGRVSGEHARLGWQGERWQVRDLGSKNGTFVNGDRIPRGATVDLSQGDTIAFGDPAHGFLLDDASPPIALARRPGSGEIRRAEDGMLVLPSDETPAACVFEAPDCTWVVEIDGEARPVEDGEILEVEGEAWILYLPTPMQGTVDAGSEAREGLPSGLRLRVSRDEERVEVICNTQNGTQALSPRAHHYTLLTLARVRLAAEERGDVPEPARGWITVDELCRMLAVDEMRLNVEIFRIRKDFAKLGLPNAAAAIERRRSSRQVRLSYAEVRIESSS